MRVYLEGPKFGLYHVYERVVSVVGYASSAFVIVRAPRGKFRLNFVFPKMH